MNSGTAWLVALLCAVNASCVSKALFRLYFRESSTARFTSNIACVAAAAETHDNYYCEHKCAVDTYGLR